MALNKINFRTFKGMVTNFQKDKESTKYDGCTYIMGESKVVYRKAHITPNKAGQFVTLYVRGLDGVIKPYDVNDDFDIVIINVSYKKNRGLFIFNKSVLNDHDIISGNSKQGKKAFRIYPPWENKLNNQASKTQIWQLEYFTKL